MRKFRFSLQAALGLRERSFEEAERALRPVQEEWNVNQRLQRELLDEVAAAEEAAHGGPVDPGDLAALDRYRTAARRRLGRMDAEAAGIARRLAERRAALQQADRDRTLLVRLQEKARSRWQMEYDREQQQLAEEAYLSRWKAR